MTRDHSVGGRRPNPEARHTNPIDAHVGQRLRLRRVSLGLSQETLAGYSGLTFQQIQKYEKGKNRISASRLFGFAQALNCPVQYFFGDLPAQEGNGGEQSKPNGADDRITEFLRSSDGLKLNEAFTRISVADVRRAIIRLVCDVADKKEIPS